MENDDPTNEHVLKRAMQAFRKRLKMTLLDDEGKSNRGAFSSGKKSGICSITPPNQFPRAVWDELVKQGRLVEVNSLYELPK